MMALWPTGHPKFLLACNEQDVSNPGVQRIDLATGKAETIVTGTTSCDPLHTTPWDTVVPEYNMPDTIAPQTAATG